MGSPFREIVYTPSWLERFILLVTTFLSGGLVIFGILLNDRTQWVAIVFGIGFTMSTYLFLSLWSSLRITTQAVVFHPVWGQETKLEWSEVTSIQSGFFNAIELYSQFPRKHIRIVAEIPQLDALVEWLRQSREDLWVISGQRRFWLGGTQLLFVLGLPILLVGLGLNTGNLILLVIGMLCVSLVFISPLQLTISSQTIAVYRLFRKQVIDHRTIKKIKLAQVRIPRGGVHWVVRLHLKNGTEMDLKNFRENPFMLYCYLATWWRKAKTQHESEP